MTSINVKVFGLTRPGFEPAGSRLKLMTFRFLRSPKSGGGRSTHLATLIGVNERVYVCVCVVGGCWVVNEVLCKVCLLADSFHIYGVG